MANNPKAFTPSAQEKKKARINKAIDAAAKSLEKEGVKFFIGAVDKQPEQTDGGQVYVQSDLNGEDFCYILDMALPTAQDAVNMGIWIGQVIQSRAKRKTQNLKGN